MKLRDSGEHTAEISGVSTGTDWTRDYSQSGALRSLLGVSTEKQGLPAEEVDEYLKKAMHEMTVSGLAI